MSITTAQEQSFRELDPLLKDLSERKHDFRRNIAKLASELKDVRNKLALKEGSFVREALSRQKAETKARNLEEEIIKLQKNLEESNGQLLNSTSTAQQHLKDLDDLRVQLSDTRAAADASAPAAESAHLQCVNLVKELDEKKNLIKDHEEHVRRLEEKLDHLPKDLQAREVSQNQFKNEVLRIEQEIMQAVAKAGASKECELKKILDEVSPKNIDKLNKHIAAEDENIAKLRDQMRIMSAHWKLKTKELESQLEKHRRADQDLKKRVLKLEFCLQEAQAQTRKLQRTGEKRDNILKELRDQLATKQHGLFGGSDKHNFWESSGFKVVASMSMLILVVFSKR